MDWAHCWRMVRRIKGVAGRCTVHTEEQMIFDGKLHPEISTEIEIRPFPPVKHRDRSSFLKCKAHGGLRCLEDVGCKTQF
jgi:hypothetical protein